MTRTNTAIISTAVTRQSDGHWTVQSPLADFVAHGKNRASAITKFFEMFCAHNFAQQRQAQGSGKRGRPSKNYETNIHVQAQTADKKRFESVAEQYKLSQSETIVFLLDCFEILKEEFATDQEMNDAENQVLQFAGAAK